MLSEVSVAPLDDDKKIVLHRIVLKLSGCWHIAQTCLLYQWRYVRRLLWWVDWLCYNRTSAVLTSSWTMCNEPKKGTHDVYGP